MDKGYVRYDHHNLLVSVREDLKGRHREFCLCYDCKKFNPGDIELNCPVAQALYSFDRMEGLVTPVWECPTFLAR